jgi:tetratricopeptide (TPR) repeat protein
VIGLAGVLYLSRDKSHEKLFAEYFAPHPNNIPVRRGEAPQGDLEQAALHYQVKEYAQALKFFENYLAANPDSVHARFYGLAYLKKNDLENARAVFNKIISYDGAYKDQAMELLDRLDSFE